MKKYFPTFIDTSAENMESFCLSAGRIGYQIELSLGELRKVIRVETADLT